MQDQQRAEATHVAAMMSLPSWSAMISSTMRDLHDERDAARRAIAAAGITVWWAEEPPSAFAGPPREFCQKMAEQCALYVPILGPNYGFTPDGQPAEHELSITQMEFLWARAESARKIRIFIQAGADMTEDARQRRFIDEVLHFDTGFVRFPHFRHPTNWHSRSRPRSANG